MMNPEISRWSSASSNATVPWKAANTPPRSMSPTTTTGIPSGRAKPMLTRSPSRRLISAGDPAPSQTTTSNRDFRSWYAASTASRSRGLSSWYDVAEASAKTLPRSTT